LDWGKLVCFFHATAVKRHRPISLLKAARERQVWQPQSKRLTGYSKTLIKKALAFLPTLLSYLNYDGILGKRNQFPRI
jgi:hypothetical protein